jgi:hypothetical protein
MACEEVVVLLLVVVVERDDVKVEEELFVAVEMTWVTVFVEEVDVRLVVLDERAMVWKFPVTFPGPPTVNVAVGECGSLMLRSALSVAQERNWNPLEGEAVSCRDEPASNHPLGGETPPEDSGRLPVCTKY